MTESEALRQFIPILGRISTPGERATITHNVLERIAGRDASVMGVSHKQAGALAWPNDTTKAQAFEAAMDAAVDAGEFVSLLHRADRRHFQIEELASWPGCPAIAPDSPLVFWLGEPAPEQASPAPVVPVSEAPEWKARAAKRAAEIIASDRKKDLYPSQADIADAIAKEFRAAGVVGAGGKPMTGAYIKRHALKGISSEQGKQLSTGISRGK